MNINDVTNEDIKEILTLLKISMTQQSTEPSTLNDMIGLKVIIRTFSAGVHFGTLVKKAKNEVILQNARRLWEWRAAEGICTHGIARYGIRAEKSRVAAPIEQLWLQAIEIIPCTEVASKSIEEAEHAHP